MDSDITYLDNCRTIIDHNNNAKIIGEIKGQEAFEIGTIYNALNFTATELNARVALKLAERGYAMRPVEYVPPKPKRKYTRRVNLGLATDYGKVTLKLASGVHTIDVYILYLKGTTKYIYKMDDKGIYVIDENKGKDGGKAKTRPMMFTKDDIRAIRNIDDFDIVKKTIEAKHVKNKIVPNGKGN